MQHEYKYNVAGMRFTAQAGRRAKQTNPFNRKLSCSIHINVVENSYHPPMRFKASETIALPPPSPPMLVKRL